MPVIRDIVILVVLSIGFAAGILRVSNRPVLAILLSAIMTAITLDWIGNVERGYPNKFFVISLPIVAAYASGPAALFVLVRQAVKWWRDEQ